MGPILAGLLPLAVVFGKERLFVFYSLGFWLPCILLELFSGAHPSPYQTPEGPHLLDTRRQWSATGNCWYTDTVEQIQLRLG
jgi:hypothetical protein